MNILCVYNKTNSKKNVIKSGSSSSSSSSAIKLSNQNNKMENKTISQVKKKTKNFAAIQVCIWVKCGEKNWKYDHHHHHHHWGHIRIIIKPIFHHHHHRLNIFDGLSLPTKKKILVISQKEKKIKPSII